MQMTPGTACTKNKFKTPIAKTTRQNSQLIIDDVMLSFMVFLSKIRRKVSRKGRLQVQPK